MWEWLKEHIVDLLAGAITLLSYFGVSAADLLGLSSYLNWAMPFVYLGIGVFAGWRIHRCQSGGGRISSMQLAGAEKPKKQLSNEEIIENFSQVPFEVKAFLKASMKYGSVYRNDHDYAWEAYSEWLFQFMTFATIRNNICRCSIRDNAKSLFERIPELLADVEERDIKPHAVRGDEGVKPQVISLNHLVWWYYEDDEDIPTPIGLVGFMRQAPWD